MAECINDHRKSPSCPFCHLLTRLLLSRSSICPYFCSAMMELRQLLYPLVFLLAYGSHAHSEANPGPSLCTNNDRIEQERIAVFIDDADLSDQFEEAFPYILEENSTESNDDDSSNNSGFDQAENSTGDWNLFLPHLFVQSRLPFSTLLPRGAALPLYLLNQVFRL